MKSTADSMQYEFRRAGYTYVAVGDCWMASKRDAQGKLQADTARFPSGMQAVAKYVREVVDLQYICVTYQSMCCVLCDISKYVLCDV